LGCGQPRGVARGTGLDAELVGVFLAAEVAGGQIVLQERPEGSVEVGANEGLRYGLAFPACRVYTFVTLILC